MSIYRKSVIDQLRDTAWTLNDLSLGVRGIANGADGTPEDVRFAQSLDSIVEALLRLVDPDEYAEED